MRKLLIVGGSILVVCLVVGLLTLRFMGYEPRDGSTGFWLTGEVVTTPVTDWSFTEAIEEIFVETRTWYYIPHSVNTYCSIYNGKLYIFSAYYQGGKFPENRYWNRNVLRDPRVRLKIGDQLFERTLSWVTDEADREAVLQTFVEKYTEWHSPGLENVHMFRVLP